MRNNSLHIIGAGVLGQHIAHYAMDSGGYDKVLFFDDTIKTGTSNKYGSVIGPTSIIKKRIISGEIDHLVVAIGYSHMPIREKFFNEYSSLVNFPNIIHKSCYFDKSNTIGKGNILLPGCIIDKNTKIGNNNFLNPGCIIAHDNEILNHAFFGPGVKTSGFVSIGNCCFLGTGTSTVDNIKIGNYITTGTGAVVCKSISIVGTYIGIPARKLNKA